MTKRICFDRILPSELRRPHRNQFGTRAIGPIGKAWPNGSTLSIRFMEGTDAQRNVVKQYAVQWTDHANLTFEFNDSPNADIRIAFADDGAWSYVGTDAKRVPRNSPTMNFGWLDEAVVLHEFGHAIGLAHEHQNPDKGIRWNEAVVIRDLSGPPNNWDEATIRHNVLNKYRADQVNGTEFDAQSIMLYSFPADWTLDGFHTEPNDTLSSQDKAFIASELMYPGRGGPPPVTALNVTEIPATTASIKEAGEEDLFRFQAATAGHYVIETTGTTDLIMKLYGPNNATQLVAEDDDSGQGYNPKIAVDLNPGEYLIQIRHYNRAAGTGDYGVRLYKT
ncbi:M12 family metallopeptidase [Lyngbya confervoides]|uniref:M12 family metallopeptidase n=1 Tax=Lyngbya confervoides BDU141951 TaxID=1574623 RepID=A0ABD4T297_9CYAN|nr:M12 family metallopeptidase [Lyngbya confervoides]MCM1982628.1 M12 family metallopeptidase [Lyngbya confervoides BDU141951]